MLWPISACLLQWFSTKGPGSTGGPQQNPQALRYLILTSLIINKCDFYTWLRNVKQYNFLGMPRSKMCYFVENVRVKKKNNS